MHILEQQGYIPLDKSWTIRLGVLDLIHGCDDCVKFLDQQENLGDDLQALKRCVIAWKENKPLDVGESGTVYRFLRFASWKLRKKVSFIKRGTLQKREIYDNPDIVNYSIKELLKLDNGTSQWANAAVLLGAPATIDNPPYHFHMTVDALDHWKNQREKNETWIPRYDETILAQATAFLNLLHERKINFTPKQQEDYCFARAFNLITKEQAAEKWPSLFTHETNRIEEMEIQLENYNNNQPITSKDHRVVQALAMKAKVEGVQVNVAHPKAVNKTWPQFWNFLEDSPKLGR